MTAASGEVAYRINASEIRRAIELYLAPGQITELRGLNVKVQGEYRRGTYSGYFQREAVDNLIAACDRIESASACYFTPNPINPALLGRSYNRARIVKDREPTTSDKDIVARRWLLVDVDPVRPAGVSATDEEKSLAEQMIVDVDYHLWEMRFPAGIIADSGNGWHLTIPIQLSADDGGFCERLLKRLSKQFDTAQVKVDITVHNPARIWKLPGTLVCKGDDCPDIGRVWRMAKIKTICNEVDHAS